MPQLNLKSTHNVVKNYYDSHNSNRSAKSEYTILRLTVSEM
jgi:hypothetical protein